MLLLNVKRYKLKNIIGVLISAVILISGNFSYALNHFSCSCAKSCCNINSCYEKDNLLKFSKTGKSCCEVSSKKIDLLESSLPLSEISVKKLISNIFINTETSITYSFSSYRNKSILKIPPVFQLQGFNLRI